MRIKFTPVKPISVTQHKQKLKDLGFANLLYYYAPAPADEPIIEYLQSYTDGCRYNLNISKGYIPFIHRGRVDLGHFCFIEIETLFDLPFNFILFREDYPNYWGRDCDIDRIKPYIYVAGSEHRTIAIAAFRSLASSFFRKIADKIGEENNIVIFKNWNSIVVGFHLNKYTNKQIDFVIENFADAVYEMVKNSSIYGYYELPDIDYKVKVSVEHQYKVQSKRNRRFKTKDKVELY